MPSIAYYDEQSVTSSFSVDGSTKERISSSRCDVPQQRRVGFVEYVAVTEFQMYSPSMREHIWYSKEEYVMIKTRNSFLVSMVKQGTFKETENHTFRGLECKLREGYKQRKWNKITSIVVVLDEQDKQLSKNTCNLDAIADVYRAATKNARESARVKGENDSKIDHTPVDLKLISRPQSPKSVAEDISLSEKRLMRISSSDRPRNRNTIA